jgi:hypothetical protein
MGVSDSYDVQMKSGLLLTFSLMAAGTISAAEQAKDAALTQET